MPPYLPIDIALYWAVLILAAFFWPLSRASIGLPRLDGNGSVSMPTSEEVQKEYNRRASIRLAVRILILGATLFLVGRALFAIGDEGLNEMPLLLADILLVSLAAGVAASTALRIRNERRVAKAMPDLGEVPMAPKIGRLIVISVPIALIIVVTRLNDIVWIYGLIGTAFLILFLAQRLLLRLGTRSQVPIPMESPLGLRVKRVVEEFGFTTRQFVTYPSPVANGIAWPNGTVMVTTALRAILDEDEIAAVLAHELSHSRDGDGKKHVRAYQIALGAGAIAGGLAAVLCAVARVPNGLAVLIEIGLLLNVLMGLQLVYARFSRRLEYKCDADVARLGQSEALARGLGKLLRYGRIPRRWSASDRPFMTHPDLESRIAAMRSVETVARTSVPPTT